MQSLCLEKTKSLTHRGQKYFKNSFCISKITKLIPELIKIILTFVQIKFLINAIENKFTLYLLYSATFHECRSLDSHYYHPISNTLLGFGSLGTNI